MKQNLWRIIIIIFLVWSIILMKSRLSVYSSSLDNTIDAQVMKIDEQKAVRESALIKIKESCKKLGDKIPHKYIIDWTCPQLSVDHWMKQDKLDTGRK